MTRTRRTFDDQFKANAVAAANIDGLSKTAKSLSISPSLIGRWRQQFAGKGHAKPAPAVAEGFPLESNAGLRQQRDEAIDLALRATKALIDRLGEA